MNPFIVGDPKLINFKYFFSSRKLFLLRESDAVALFPAVWYARSLWSA